MRTRLLLVTCGVCLGLVANWLVQIGPARQPQANPASRTATVSISHTPVPEPLGGPVPPLHVPGLPPAGDRLAAVASTEPPDVDELLNSFPHGDRAIFHAHGQKVCASGCAVSRHPTPDLSAETFHRLMTEFASEPISEESAALEALLFYGRQTRRLIEKEGFAPLDAPRAAALWRELLRTRAQIAIRVVDENGEVRSWLPPTQVPLDRRHVFDMETRHVQPLVTSGTVKRVGLDHLWTRL